MTRTFARLAALGLFAAAAGAASAHHSFAMYDPAKIVTLDGTVKTFQWTNPHALIWVLSSPDAKGGTELWSVELPTSPVNLTRMGWTKHALSPGDHVRIDINPLRDGSHGGSLKKVTLTATGQVLTAAPPAYDKPQDPKAAK